MAYKAMENLLIGRRQILTDFKAGKILSVEAIAKLKDFDKQIKEEEKRHRKSVASYHARIKGRNRKWQNIG